MRCSQSQLDPHRLALADEGALGGGHGAVAASDLAEPGHAPSRIATSGPPYANEFVCFC
jgi:hypothetical protein